MVKINESDPWFECRLESCEEKFQKRVHNQAFCSKECCRVYTNARILAQYHSKKNKVMKGRVCKHGGCDTLLSRYNDNEYCAKHEEDRRRAKLTGWGWNMDEFGQIIT